MRNSKHWIVVMVSSLCVAGGCALDDGGGDEADEVVAADELPEDGALEAAGVRSCRTAAVNAAGTVSLTVGKQGKAYVVSRMTWSLTNVARTLARTDLRMDFQVLTSAGTWASNGTKFLRYDVANGAGGVNLSASIETFQQVRAKVSFRYDQAGAAVTRSCYVTIK